MKKFFFAVLCCFPLVTHALDYVFDDHVRYNCDVDMAKAASEIMTQEALEKGLIKPGTPVYAWMVDYSDKNLFGINSTTKKVEQIRTAKFYPFQFRDKLSQVELTCAAENRESATRMVSLDEYVPESIVTDRKEVISRLCYVAEKRNSRSVQLVLVKNRLFKVKVDNKDITNTCNLNHLQDDVKELSCSYDDLYIDLRQTVTIPGNELLDWLSEIVGGPGDSPKEFHKGSIRGGFFGLSTYDVLCPY